MISVIFLELFYYYKHINKMFGCCGLQLDSYMYPTGNNENMHMIIFITSGKMSGLCLQILSIMVVTIKISRIQIKGEERETDSQLERDITQFVIETVNERNQRINHERKETLMASLRKERLDREETLVVKQKRNQKASFRKRNQIYFKKEFSPA